MTARPPWTCDTCGQSIERVEDGWVEWLNRRGTLNGHNLRLVHDHNSSPRGGKYGCQHNEDEWFRREGSTVADLPLESFVGDDGLMTLLEFLSDGKFQSDELIEFIKRLHIEGYEQARHSFSAAISDGAFEPSTKPGFHSQRDIAATLEWMERRDSES